MSYLTLSPKHGVNPMIPTCFYCGKLKNEVALMGRIGGKADLEAPRSAVIDYCPCEECQKKFNEGVLIIEVNEEPNFENQMPLSKMAYPTGRYVVLKPETINPNLGMHKGSRACMLSEDYQQLFNTEE